jgi:hypothetical protein
MGRHVRRQLPRLDIHFRGAALPLLLLRTLRTQINYENMESGSIPNEIASTLQGASIKRHPSPRHDLNPSTAASAKQPVTLDSYPDPDADSDVAEDEIPISVLNPVPRKQNMPPLPDLRFEQSYLKSIESAESWQGVLWITLKDQVQRWNIWYPCS